MQDLLQTFEQSRRKVHRLLLPEPILIYGAGNKGRQVAEFLRDRGHNVIGLADARASGMET
jgi:UDP-N-acetylmuramoylalanine-D-glutamate ligase